MGVLCQRQEDVRLYFGQPLMVEACLHPQNQTRVTPDSNPLWTFMFISLDPQLRLLELVSFLLSRTFQNSPSSSVDTDETVLNILNAFRSIVIRFRVQEVRDICVEDDILRRCEVVGWPVDRSIC